MLSLRNLLLAVGAAASLPAAASDMKDPAKAMAAEDQRELEVWVDLSVAPLSTARHASAAEREALRTRIGAQQDEVALALAALGATETGRVQLLRNSIAVRIPRGRIDEVRRISGVSGVRVVRHVMRPPPDPKG